MTTLWLLPVVTLIVASSGGGALVQALSAYTTSGALMTLAGSACTLSAGLALASGILTMYLCRLVLHGFPSGTAGVLSACVPLGPMGQAGVAALLLGEGARTLLPVAAGTGSSAFANAHAGEYVYTISVCAALGLWALATLWLGYALLGMQHVVRRSGLPPFQLAYWGLIFPNVRKTPHNDFMYLKCAPTHAQGVYANLTIALAHVLEAPFLRVWGAIYAVVTLFLWIVVFSRTVVMVPNGRIFDAPCLQKVDVSAMATPTASASTQTIPEEKDGAVPVDDGLRQEKTRESMC